MPQAKHFKRSEMTFAAYGGPPGKATIARLVGPDMSKTMGAGIATFDGCSIEWTVLYDEVIVVLEGKFRLRLGEGYRQVMEAGPGDLIVLEARCLSPWLMVDLAPGHYRVEAIARDSIVRKFDLTVPGGRQIEYTVRYQEIAN